MPNGGLTTGRRPVLSDRERLPGNRQRGDPLTGAGVGGDREDNRSRSGSTGDDSVTNVALVVADQAHPAGAVTVSEPEVTSGPIDADEDDKTNEHPADPATG